MATKRVVQRQCDRLNRERRVSTVQQYTFWQFWVHSPGNFLITGGTEAARTRALCEKLFCAAECDSVPSLVLTTSDMLEREIIRCNRAGAPGFLTVTSSNCRNYHFFYRWSPEDITRFLVQASRLVGCFQVDVPIYIHALIEILNCCYAPGLAALSSLAAHSDGEIAQIGRRCGAPELAVEQIVRCAEAGQLFRLILRQVSSVLSPLSTADCSTKYNLSALNPEEDGIYLVNIQSLYPDLMAAYFNIEFQLAMNRTRQLRLVFSDLDFQRDTPLGEILRNAQMWNVEVGVSTQNASVLLGRENENFQNRVVLLDAGYAAGDLEAVLRPLGTYTHYEVVTSGGRPPKLFAILTDEHWTLGSEPNRLRVRPCDTEGFQAVLYGCGSQDIFLVRAVD